MSRAVVLAWLLAACGSNVGGGDEVTDAPGPDPVDAPGPDPIDAPPARPCTGGDQSMTAPDGSCFLLFSTPRTYEQAKGLCEINNAHLALLTTSELDVAAEAFIGNADTWIGLDDLVVENSFVWVDGTPLAFANWHTATNEPNNSGGGGYEEDCAIIAGARLGKQWDDRPCAPDPTVGGGEYAVLCQF
jgi:hypothetical protein